MDAPSALKAPGSIIICSPGAFASNHLKPVGFGLLIILQNFFCNIGS